GSRQNRTNAGRRLPPYYLVYFMLVDVLGFRNLGRWEKTDWILPGEFGGKTFTIEYRKMGLGLFIPNAKDEEAAANRIVDLIRSEVRAAEPFFEWLATQTPRLCVRSLSRAGSTNVGHPRQVDRARGLAASLSRRESSGCRYWTSLCAVRD